MACFVLFLFRLVVFLVWFLVFCFAGVFVWWFCRFLCVFDAIGLSLDYVQIHNRSLLWPIDGLALACTNSLSGKYKLVKRPGGSHEGVGRKKKRLAGDWMGLNTDLGIFTGRNLLRFKVLTLGN